LRLEEMTIDDLQRAAPYCDTIVVALGGLRLQPPHLPIGTAWYIERKLRDSLEMALGGRILTLPVISMSESTEPAVFYPLPAGGVEGLIQGIVREISQYLKIRYIIVLSDSVHSAAAATSAPTGKDEDANALRTLTFVWWRDGIGEEARYIPGGELETSVLLAIGKRLVQVDAIDALQPAAARATAQQGESWLERIEGELRSRVTALWQLENE